MRLEVNWRKKMATRRDMLKLGLVGGGAALTTGLMGATPAVAQLCSPDDIPPYPKSPPTRPFIAPLFIPPIKQPVDPSTLNPPVDPAAHQRYNEFLPRKFYVQSLQTAYWQYHPDLQPTLSLSFDGILPGPTFQSFYGEPLLVRRYNNIPADLKSFAVPFTSTHLHNFHTASESDGNPADWISTGQYRDHHYAMFPAGNDPSEILSTLWYHDHMHGFTAANVYAGLSGFHLMFDKYDSNNENDKTPGAFQLPSGQYDVPLILHDVIFDNNGQAVFNQMVTDGLLGDKYTVNRIVQPYFVVSPRKYRFRLLNGGPSRLYRIALGNNQPFTLISTDGNMLPAPLTVTSIDLNVADRSDFIVDFSQNKPGDQVVLYNQLQQVNGRGPTGVILNPGDPLMVFSVTGPKVKDPSRIPQTLRPLPTINLNEVVAQRTWRFDYDGGAWTVNGLPFDPDRIDAHVQKGTAEIWTITNGGSDWSHPVHIHFEEFQILSRNGLPVLPNDPEHSRKDVIALKPNEEVKCFFRFRDFTGKYVMHCHNVVHEDHAMMIRFDIE
jgi:FtsP/CotA-like multicopper oxidase with cupredoxin domain